MAEGDKVVPSGGNPQLDPTRDNKWPSALNAKLGVTGKSLTSAGVTGKALSSAGVTSGSLTGETERRGALQSERWQRNKNGVLVDTWNAGWNTPTYDDSSKSRDFAGLKPQKSAASPDGEEEEDDKPEAVQQIYRKPRPISGPKVSQAFNGTFGTMNFKSSVMKMACDGKVGQFPLQTLLPQSAGPFLPLVFSTQGGAMQPSTPEAMNKGLVVNQLG